MDWRKIVVSLGTRRGRGRAVMGEQADYLTEKHMDAIAQGDECEECGAPLEFAAHEKWCKIGKQEER